MPSNVYLNLFYADTTQTHRVQRNVYVEKDGTVLAEMVYTMPSPDKMIIEHTEVDDGLQGKKIGYQLVHAGVEYAREKQMKIIPLCSFARAIFNKTPDFNDVLA